MKKFNKRLIQPRSIHPDDQRREYIFNVFCGLFTFAAILTTISSGVTHLLGANAHTTNSVPITFGFLVFISTLWWLSRRGKYKFGAHILVALLVTASLELATSWSIELPMAQLLNVLLIVVAGIVISSRAALFVTSLISLTTLILGYVQTHNLLDTNTSWLTKKLEFSDAIGLVVIYAIVGAVSWLANNEIDSLLKRAWHSEKALATERDQLEVTVAERTRELEHIQLQKTLEMQEFVEFGRVSASLVHDISSPLTAASINLEQAGDQASSTLLSEAMVSVRHIENYIGSARKQLERTNQPKVFRISAAAQEVMSLLKHQARVANVRLELAVSNHDQVFGDPVAFHRVLANLVINGIQSYHRSKVEGDQVVLVSIESHNNLVTIIVKDFGTGIRAEHLPHIFEDFYSSKKNISRGLGLGLANAKRVIEQEFGGNIEVQSKPRQGTTFTIGIPHHEATSTKKHSKRPPISGDAPNIKRKI